MKVSEWHEKGFINNRAPSEIAGFSKWKEYNLKRDDFI